MRDKNLKKKDKVYKSHCKSNDFFVEKWNYIVPLTVIFRLLHRIEG